MAAIFMKQSRGKEVPKFRLALQCRVLPITYKAAF